MRECAVEKRLPVGRFELEWAACGEESSSEAKGQRCYDVICNDASRVLFCDVKRIRLRLIPLLDENRM